MTALLLVVGLRQVAAAAAAALGIRRTRTTTTTTMSPFTALRVPCASFSCCQAQVAVPSRLASRNHNQHHHNRRQRLSSGTTTTTTLMLRRSSSMAAHLQNQQQQQQHELLHPLNLFNGTIPYPKSLSPSAIMEFKACPQSYLFQYLYGMKQPTNSALALGSMCHEALEKVYDLEPSDRTLENLQNLFRSSWAQHRNEPIYQDLFATSTAEVDDDDIKNDIDNRRDRERTWGRAGLQLLENYVHLEDPRLVQRPNPVQREVWVRADLAADPARGITAAAAGATAATHNGACTAPVNGAVEPVTIDAPRQRDVLHDTNDTFHVRGIVDRLDIVRVETTAAATTTTTAQRSNDKHSHSESTRRGPQYDDNGGGVALRIVDYKTGKAPNFKYSPSMNQQIANQAFYQLKVYALLMRESNHVKAMASANHNANGGYSGTNGGNYGLPVRMLRLLFLTSEMQRGQFLDLDLGATQEERDATLHEIHVDLANVWKSICQLVERQDPKAFVGCNRSFCYCHKCRTKFVPGTVWEPSSTSDNG